MFQGEENRFSTVQRKDLIFPYFISSSNFSLHLATLANYLMLLSHLQVVQYLYKISIIARPEQLICISVSPDPRPTVHLVAAINSPVVAGWSWKIDTNREKISTYMEWWIGVPAGLDLLPVVLAVDGGEEGAPGGRFACFLRRGLYL